MDDEPELCRVAERLGHERSLGKAVVNIRRLCSALLVKQFGVKTSLSTIFVDGRRNLSWRSGGISGRIGPTIGIADAVDFLVLLPNEGILPRIALIGAQEPGVCVRPVAANGLRDSAPAILDLERWTWRTRSLPAVEGVDDVIDEVLAEEASAFCTAILALAGDVLSTTAEFTGTRVHNGGTLLEYQAVRHTLADLHGEIRLARAMLAWTNAGPKPRRNVRADQGMLALLVEDCARHIIDRCLQLFGGLGYMASNWVSQAYQDIQALYLIFGERALQRDATLKFISREDTLRA